MSSTKSTLLAMSIMLLMSLLHSISVIRRFFDVTTVMGPQTLCTLVLVKFLIKFIISVVLPTFGGPTTATSTGGGSSGVLSTSGMCCFFVMISSLRRNRFSADRALVMAKAFGFFVRSVGLFFAFFLSALTPECRFLWAFFLSP
uniref:Uncharacterized protein n=1 Tax=Anopheles darlingi TaxID=43151 RepID=A0A2M4DBT8_ANODA